MAKPIRPAFLAATLVSLALGCVGGRSPEGQGPTLAEGGRIWANTCNRCHNLRPPRQYTAAQWPVIVNHMRTRADLTKREALAVASYLRRVASDGEGAGSGGDSGRGSGRRR